MIDPVPASFSRVVLAFGSARFKDNAPFRISISLDLSLSRFGPFCWSKSLSACSNRELFLLCVSILPFLKKALSSFTTVNCLQFSKGVEKMSLLFTKESASA
ncbi:hypothetical protein O6H91_09G096900 [Diphasiastrum complanatum]|uniref:Uncharacterized protein n=1 Tax=Diphasiastrum complanatum TaxID=34168 RepID=A0ACC2CSJ4_DIPCM|nr:hypothetical protein O6H91_09G096900 [Diphasiastrum complanatum]